MNKFIKRILNIILGPLNINLERSTPKKSILSLIQKLKPCTTNRELLRFGPNGDGGYLIPNDLVDIEACFSPGVGPISEFENECLDHGMKVFLADKSVEAPPQNNSEFKFTKKFIGTISNKDFMTLDSWVENSEVDSDSDLLLQMDIEGHEYLTLVNLPEKLINRFRIIVIEFHTIDKLWNRTFYEMALAAFEKILKNHSCVHIHPNNCCGIDKRKGIEIPRVAEFTFLRNDRISLRGPQYNYPNPLDFDNYDNKHISLPQNWFSIGTN